MEKTIAEIRKEYRLQSLLEENAPPDPFQLFRDWWKAALESEIEEPNAMTLATATADGLPSARIVLLKDMSESGFIFFTNYNSFKGKEVAQNPKACLVFFWKELERQVRITGMVEKIAGKDSDEYFNSRPEGSRIGALASPQSQVIESRQWLDDHYNNLTKQMEGSNIQRPHFWGGYIVRPAIVEFWQGRPNRLHDRLQYRLDESNAWKIERLAP